MRNAPFTARPSTLTTLSTLAASIIVGAAVVLCGVTATNAQIGAASEAAAEAKKATTPPQIQSGRKADAGGSAWAMVGAVGLLGILMASTLISGKRGHQD